MAAPAQLPAFELYVLLSVARLGEEHAYGVTIRRDIEQRTRRSVSIGAVYASLARLADKDLVTFTISDPEPVRGGRSRKLVAVSAAGRRVLRDSTRAWTRMLDGLTPTPSERR